MLPFPVTLTPGESPYRQVVYAATKAIVAGVMPAGTPFPSVRELSQALRINPNTAHKVVAELVRNGLLEVMPGVGTVVARNGSASAADRAALLSTQVEQLVVEALRLGVDEHTVRDAIAARWRELSGAVPMDPSQSESHEQSSANAPVASTSDRARRSHRA